MPTPAPEFDLCVVGLGPAGRALAARGAQAGLKVAAVDPFPERIWRRTYCAWVDELPAWVDSSALVTVDEDPLIWTTEEIHTGRPFALLSKPRLFEILDLAAVSIFASRAGQVSQHTVTLQSGDMLHAGIVVDARGITKTGNSRVASAHGIFVAEHLAARIAPPGRVVLTDWRPENGAAPSDLHSFLYVVPMGDGTVLLEEVAMGFPGGLSQHELSGRLAQRLATHRIGLSGSETHEVAHYAMVSAPPPWLSWPVRRREPIVYGSRGGLVNPYTGFSVANSFALADRFVTAIAAGRDPVAAVWTVRARLVHWLRCHILEAFGRLDGQEIQLLINTVYRISLAKQRHLTSDHDALLGLFSAYAALAWRMPGSARRKLVLRRLHGR